MKIEILDSTLRDGCQGEGIDFSVEDKLKVIALLKKLAVDVIEIENPNTNPKNNELCERITDYSNISIFTPTVRKHLNAEKDPNFIAITKLKASTITIVGKTALSFVNDIIGVDAKSNLEMIRESVSYFTKLGKRVIFDAEHFFDGYLQDKDYSLKCLQTAKDSGADTLVLCDTNGGAMESEIEKAFIEVVSSFSDCKIGIHAHDDCGLAVANTLKACSLGASHIQGTLLGFGERLGNLALASVIPTLQLKMDFDCISFEALSHLTPYCRELAEIANITLNKRLPYISPLAFTHKAGMHQDGIYKDSAAFEQVSPEKVGNTRRMLLSDLSGKASIKIALKSMNVSLPDDSPFIEKLVYELKKKEAAGYSYEGAKASFSILVDKVLGNYTPKFELISYRVINEMPYSEATPATAIIKLAVNGISKLASSQGDGPVHALDLAMRNALISFYPLIKNVNLIDYKVRVINPEDTTASKVRVLISTTDGITNWTTVGVSTDIIEASWIALSDSINFILK